MASASTSSVEKSYMYDVFVSFRGKDLRTSFVDHLFEGFRRHGIIVFKDDKDIQVGRRISDELPKAIKDSKFRIVIFSQKYADSYWCLNELVEILESQNPEEEQTFFPIFYHVKPSEVREQKGPVGEAFAVHSANETAGRWRAAMEKAATLEGWELTKTGDGHEVQFIEKIVHAISQKPYFANFSVNDNLVGMTTRVEKLLLSLQVGFDDVRMLGITGLGGVGKTTLASVVFNRIANQFDGKSFVENVRERSKDPKGLQDMQQQVLTCVFGDPKIKVSSDVEGRNMMKRRMPSIKVLVVLDDVNHGNQLEALAEPSWFRPGSRIIITSRDKQVLVAHGVQSHNIHDVSTLSDEDAIRLLSKYAFNTECPVEGYEELSKEVLRYAAGLPLTIKTLSSSLRACSTVVWEDAIKRLETTPWGNTLEVLKISYDALEEDQKEIFLHVACLLKGETKKRAIRILESLGFHAQFGLEVLEQKSLITFRDGHKYYNPNDAYDDDDDKRLLDMHDHVEEMGMHIVRSLYPDEPGRHKLLWIDHEIKTIVEKDMGTKTIRGIKLLYSDLPPAKVLQSLRKMRRLCFLHVGWSSKDEFVEADKYLPNSLQYLYWHRYPYRYLPKTFQADKLVVMEMPNSHIHQLWKGGENKVLPKLKLLDLRGSNVLETFDSAGMLPNLEELVLRRCYKLVEVNISDECSHLKKLDLDECKALEKLTISNECLKSLNLYDIKLRSLNLGLTPNLEVLSVEYCRDLEELVMPVELPRLRDLYVFNDKDEHYGQFSYLLDKLTSLEVLCLSFPYMKRLPDDSIYMLKHHLRVLDLGWCRNLEQLPEDLDRLECLEELNLRFCRSLRSIPNCICNMSRLKTLNLSWCYKLEKLPDEFGRLQSLQVLQVRYISDMLKHHLRVLDLRGCRDLEQLPEDLDRLECLEKLILWGCESLRSIPDCICNLTRLKRLDLYGCYKLEKLPDEFGRLQSLQVLDVSGGIADRLKNLTESISQLKHLVVYK